MEIINGVILLTALIIIFERIRVYFKKYNYDKIKKNVVSSAILISISTLIIFIPYYIGILIFYFTDIESWFNRHCHGSMFFAWLFGLAAFLVISFVILLFLYIFIAIYESIYEEVDTFYNNKKIKDINNINANL